MEKQRNDIRNIAVIAHVDHGKTTLVDGLLRQSGIFHSKQQVRERVMDSGDLERERGITILSKNTAVHYEGVRINILDTPGHADFGGEVERVLKMVDGVLLLVDAFEGPRPQTRFVLKKAFALKLAPIVVINKIDRPDARATEVLDELLDLFIELGADEDQLDFPVVFASAKQGVASLDLQHRGENLKPLFEAILGKVPAPLGDPDGPLQVLITALDYDDYVGKIAIGRVVRGSLKSGGSYGLWKRDGRLVENKISGLYLFDGLSRVAAPEAALGDIIAVTGMDDIAIGETLTDLERPEPVDYVNIDEPTLAMTFRVNDSPFAGTEGTYVTSRQLRERLFREVRTNVSLRVEETGETDRFRVSGRGELHLAILIETMRREGYEFAISSPEVILKETPDGTMEPTEHVVIDIPEGSLGIVMEKMGSRRGVLDGMANVGPGSLRLDFSIPTRGLLGYRSEFITDTRGEGILNALFAGYQPLAGEVPSRSRGALVAFERGESTAYGLYNAQERGTLFIGPGTPVYEGMIIGENARPDDLPINVCKKKQITNMRASGSDDALRLSPPRQMSLEKCLEFIEQDELVEVTPVSVRMRKALLTRNQRNKARK